MQQAKNKLLTGAPGRRGGAVADDLEMQACPVAK